MLPLRVCAPAPLLLALLASTPACGPVVRGPDFVGARDQVTEATLLGPFDGQVVDAATSEPVQGATVVGVWSYDRGDGLIGPRGSEILEAKTDQAGRYRIPRAPLRVRGAHTRLVSFELIVYKRGYMAYRSDALPEGGRRNDFQLRHNRVNLQKWRESDSHAQHLLFLTPPPEVERLAKWAREDANLDLYRLQSGAEVSPPGETTEPTPGPAKLQVLDASGLLPAEEVRRRTGYPEPFEVKDLVDLKRTHFYHGVHMQAVGRDEPWDVAYRVWKDPPGGLDPVRETLEATLPGVPASSEITKETWVFDGPDVRAVAFLDRDRAIGVLLTCGAQQCADIETVIILANYLYERLDELQLVDAEDEPEPAAPLGGRPPAPTRGAPTGTEPEPTPEPTESPEPTPTESKEAAPTTPTSGGATKPAPRTGTPAQEPR